LEELQSTALSQPSCYDQSHLLKLNVGLDVFKLVEGDWDHHTVDIIFMNENQKITDASAHLKGER